MFGGLFSSIWHRIKWLGIFILVIFGYLAVTDPSGIGAAANTMGNILGGVVGGFLTILQHIGSVLSSHGLGVPHH